MFSFWLFFFCFACLGFARRRSKMEVRGDFLPGLRHRRVVRSFVGLSRKRNMDLYCFFRIFCFEKTKNETRTKKWFDADIDLLSAFDGSTDKRKMMRQSAFIMVIIIIIITIIIRPITNKLSTGTERPRATDWQRRNR